MSPADTCDLCKPSIQIRSDSMTGLSESQLVETAMVFIKEIEKKHILKGSLTVWALYAYFSDSQNAAFELLVWCM